MDHSKYIKILIISNIVLLVITSTLFFVYQRKVHDIELLEEEISTAIDAAYESEDSNEEIEEVETEEEADVEIEEKGEPIAKDPVVPEKTLKESETPKAVIDMPICGDAFDSPIPSEELSGCYSGSIVEYSSGKSVENTCWAKEVFKEYIENKNLSYTITSTTFLGTFWDEETRATYNNDYYWLVVYSESNGGNSQLYVNQKGEVLRLLGCI